MLYWPNVHPVVHTEDPGGAPAQLAHSERPVNFWNESAGHNEGDGMPRKGHSLPAGHGVGEDEFDGQKFPTVQVIPIDEFCGQKVAA